VASVSSRRRPNRAVTLKIRKNTAYGANRITMSMMRTVTAARLSRNETIGCARSAVMVVSAMPMNSAKTITASISPSAIALIGLRGTKLTKVLMPSAPCDRPIICVDCPL
jgi:hypothetical protein